MKLTGLSCRIFYEKWRYVLVHSHFIFSNAGVGTSVFIPNTADVELTPICCKRETHEQSSWSLLSSSITACCSHDSRGFGGILMRADVLLLSISTYKLGARNEQRKIRKVDSKLKVCLVKYCLVQWKNKINTLTLQMVFFYHIAKKLRLGEVSQNAPHHFDFPSGIIIQNLWKILWCCTQDKSSCAASAGRGLQCTVAQGSKELFFNSFAICKEIRSIFTVCYILICNVGTNRKVAEERHEQTM